MVYVPGVSGVQAKVQLVVSCGQLSRSFPHLPILPPRYDSTSGVCCSAGNRNGGIDGHRGSIAGEVMGSRRCKVCRSRSCRQITLNGAGLNPHIRKKIHRRLCIS